MERKTNFIKHIIVFRSKCYIKRIKITRESVILELTKEYFLLILTKSKVISDTTKE